MISTATNANTARLSENGDSWSTPVHSPIALAASDMNLYRYVGNNPTNATDPSGLQPFVPIPPIVPLVAGPNYLAGPYAQKVLAGTNGPELEQLLNDRASAKIPYSAEEIIALMKALKKHPVGSGQHNRILRALNGVYFRDPTFLNQIQSVIAAYFRSIAGAYILPSPVNALGSVCGPAGAAANQLFVGQVSATINQLGNPKFREREAARRIIQNWLASPNTVTLREFVQALDSPEMQIHNFICSELKNILKALLGLVNTPPEIVEFVDADILKPSDRTRLLEAIASKLLGTPIKLRSTCT